MPSTNLFFLFLVLMLRMAEQVVELRALPLPLQSFSFRTYLSGVSRSSTGQTQTSRSARSLCPGIQASLLKGNENLKYKFLLPSTVHRTM